MKIKVSRIKKELATVVFLPEICIHRVINWSAFACTKFLNFNSTGMFVRIFEEVVNDVK